MLIQLICASAFIFFALFLCPSFTSAANTITYAQHCESVVPPSVPTDFFTNYKLYLYGGYFTGGSDLFSLDANSKHPKSPTLPIFNFHCRHVHRTRDANILQLVGSLSLRQLDGNQNHSSRMYSGSNEIASFTLSGFWSQPTGKLCLVGNGHFYGHEQGSYEHLAAVVKLNLPTKPNISTSFVTGTVESLDSGDGGQKKFEPISLLAYNSINNYTYTMIDKVDESCSKHKTDQENLNKIEGMTTCSNELNYLLGDIYRLKHGDDTSVVLGFAAKFMSLNMIRCSQDGNFSMYIRFTNISAAMYENPMMPQNSLVAEGFWDLQRNRLCLLACSILWEKSYASVADCSIRLSLWLPKSLSLKNRSLVIGHIWNEKKDGMVPFQSQGYSRTLRIPGLRYSYNYSDTAKKSCKSNNIIKSSYRIYPDPRITNDMQFAMHLKDERGKTYSGYASLVSLNEDCHYYYEREYILTNGTETANSTTPAAATTLVETNTSLWNISYKMTYSMSKYALVGSSYDGYGQTVLSAEEQTELLAEGIYNSETGKLCMVGCRSVENQRKDIGSDTMDCNIDIDIQLSPLNPEFGGHLSGKIISSRKEEEALYFSPLEISSHVMYAAQAKESIKRMDIEVVMLLVSLTLSCVCITMQLFHVRKHPDVLSSISIMMLVILTLSYMIPLLLNFEALVIKSRNNDNLLSTGGWLEAKEVIMRVMMLAAFLLQFRLLQSSWSAKFNEDKKRLWIAEKDTLMSCLPLYLAGALMTWFVKSRSYASRSQWQDLVRQQHSLWSGLMNYAGLILDGFLLPQVILNMFSESKDKALNPFFYSGITMVRAFPHVYDVYRARHYVKFNTSQIYAGSEGDFYSLAWDIIIPCGGMLFAVLIFLQQRFGGACIIPTKFRKVARYEVVPSAGA